LDRLLATKLGAFAVETAVQGQSGVMVGECNHNLVTTPLEQVWEQKKPLDPYLFKIQKILSQ
jgi:6-phosphofructokinase 1